MSTRAEDLRPGDCWVEYVQPLNRQRRVRMVASRPGTTPASIIIEAEDTGLQATYELHLYRVNHRRVIE